MTRNQFKKHILKTMPQSSSELNLLEDAPIWIPEIRDGWKAKYFAECWPHRITNDPSVWVWCRENLSKVPMCYMSNADDRKEWWGFNTKNDMLLFLLRWS